MSTGDDRSMCNPITTRNPDALLLKGEHQGFQWEVTHNGRGYRCGYVRVPVGHPWHGRHHEKIHANVHDGISFAEADTDCGKGGEDDAWWVGFSGRGTYDLPDPELPGADIVTYNLMIEFPEMLIRTNEWMRNECVRLCEQAAQAMSEFN